MIFVTVGSMAPFDELIIEVDRFVGEGLLDSGVAQIGNGRYIPKNLEWFRYKPSLFEYYRKADLIITHGGAGTIFEVVRLGKKVIALQNPKAAYNPDILIKMSRDGHILFCPALKLLREFVEKARVWTPKRYEPPPCMIPEIIIKYLSCR